MTILDEMRFTLSAISSFPLSCNLRETAETNKVIKMAKNVSECKVSTSVNEEDSGNTESMIYLLPTAANRPPTGKPKRSSSSEGCGVKLITAIRNAMYMPTKIFMNNPHAFRSMSISMLKVEKTWYVLLASPNPVS